MKISKPMCTSTNNQKILLLRVYHNVQRIFYILFLNTIFFPNIPLELFGILKGFHCSNFILTNENNVGNDRAHTGDNLWTQPNNNRMDRKKGRYERTRYKGIIRQRTNYHYFILNCINYTSHYTLSAWDWRSIKCYCRCFFFSYQPYK